MPSAKVHALREKVQYPTINLSFTHCGKSGIQDRHMASEYTTMDGRDARFEVATGSEKPTCRRCIESISIRAR